MKALEAPVRSIEKDGLVWGASQLVPVGFGIKKLQINLVVEDEKVSTSDLEEEMYVPPMILSVMYFHANDNPQPSFRGLRPVYRRCCHAEAVNVMRWKCSNSRRIGPIKGYGETPHRLTWRRVTSLSQPSGMIIHTKKTHRQRLDE